MLFVGVLTVFFLPESLKALTRKENWTVHLTTKEQVPFALSYGEIVDGEFRVYGSQVEGEFSWEVKAVRADVVELEVEVEELE